jgi:hypothetical protein
LGDRRQKEEKQREGWDGEERKEEEGGRKV